MTVLRRDPARIAAHAGAELAAAKVKAIAEINLSVGKARQKYITTSPGQEMIYLAKEREALAYLPNPTDDLSTYPMLEAEIGVTAPTARELAQLWANVSVQWRAIAARIEGTRMRSIAQIENCADPDDLNAILATFRPLQERL